MGSSNVGKMELDGGKYYIKLHKIRITYQITPGTEFIFKLNIAHTHDPQQCTALTKDVNRER